MITFYDLATKPGIKTSSPNPWKTRYVLNYKKLPYKTVYLEFMDIEPEFKKVGIPASTTKLNGTPHYTCPSIFDHSNNTAVTDSYKIAEYLDEAYPDTPRVIPKGSEALQAAFYDQLMPLVMPVFPILMSSVTGMLSPVNAEYFIRARSEQFGASMFEFPPDGEARVAQWKKVEAAIDTLNGWLSKSNGPYFMGETVSFADFVVASLFQALRIILSFNNKLDEWENMMAWNNGRWKKFLDDLEPYAGVEN
ncbi:hypothetical protein NP233_g9862 [Leucocoprinus birnbaumii]|uniref:GST N-terminal domain-containing protein n=1 Tax=Leucocoprinus birnbaumii TaxID=56174 RepID=A0AAD5YMS3_9AGAR|nr:hypothetical protein NP233_g9862 [Leucocoprinus birnbaumii]